MTTFRGALRAVVLTAIASADTIIASDNLFAEYDWPATTASEPMLSVTVRRWGYEDRTQGIGAPQFWAQYRVGVEIRAAQNDENGTGRALLVDQLDTLSDQIDAALMGIIVNPPGSQAFRRIVRVDGEMAIDASGGQHQGSLDLSYVFETTADASPELTDFLEQVALFYVKKLRAGGRLGGRFVDVLGSFLTNIPQV